MIKKIMRYRLLITGGSGLLATNWAYLMRNNCDVCLVMHTQSISMENVESSFIDLNDRNDIYQKITSFSPDVVVHTAGMTNVDKCEEQLEEAIIANKDIACNVAHVSKDIGVKCVQISTDHLFSGEQKMVAETETTEPLNVYASTKRDAELCVRELNPEALIIRTNFFGWGHLNRTSFSDWVINSLSDGSEITVFDDVYYTPILIDDLVKCTHMLLEKNLSGIFNVTGNERISKYDFAKMVADEFNLEHKLIKRGSISDVSLIAKRPRDMSLANTKVKSLVGFEPLTLREALHNLRLQQEQCRSDVLDSIFNK